MAAASAVANTEGDQLSSAAGDGWPERFRGRKKPIRGMAWENGRGFGSVAEQAGSAKVGCRTGAFVKRREDRPALSETTLPWSRTRLSEAGMGQSCLNRGQVYAQTFGAGRRKLALEGDAGPCERRGEGRARSGRDTEVEWWRAGWDERGGTASRASTGQPLD